MQKIIRTGSHSLAVVIPASFARTVGVKAGDTVEVQTRVDTGDMSIHFTGVNQLPLMSARKNRTNE